MLTARGVGYVLPNGRELFSSVCFDLRRGEAVAVEGPSGIGKSTLLGVLGGLLQPTSGSVRIEGGDGPPFAWVLQTLNCLGARTALANAGLLARLDGAHPAATKRRAEEVLAGLGLAQLIGTRARRLSGGEVQRVGVARALVSDRPMILADEPTNQLDQVSARLVMGQLVDAATKAGRAVLIVTHDRASLPEQCAVLRLTPDGLTRDGLTRDGLAPDGPAPDGPAPVAG